jgi:hypothetical protein
MSVLNPAEIVTFANCIPQRFPHHAGVVPAHFPVQHDLPPLLGKKMGDPKVSQGVSVDTTYQVGSGSSMW